MSTSKTARASMNAGAQMAAKVVSSLQRWLFGPAALFKPNVPMMVDCKRCERFVRNRAANGLATHLIYDHQMDHEGAYKTVDWVFIRLQEHLRNGVRARCANPWDVVDLNSERKVVGCPVCGAENDIREAISHCEWRKP